jgi:DNA replication protein DnaC
MHHEALVGMRFRVGISVDTERGQRVLQCVLGMLALARGDGRYGKLMRSLARVKLRILDDWGPETLTPEQARDLLEIIEDRYETGSVLLTSQVPVARWHDMIGIPTIADAILDRLVHNAYRIELSGDSLRKRSSA